MDKRYSKKGNLHLSAKRKSTKLACKRLRTRKRKLFSHGDIIEPMVQKENYNCKPRTIYEFSTSYSAPEDNATMLEERLQPSTILEDFHKNESNQANDTVSTETGTEIATTPSTLPIQIFGRTRLSTMKLREDAVPQLNGTDTHKENLTQRNFQLSRADNRSDLIVPEFIDVCESNTDTSPQTEDCCLRQASTSETSRPSSTNETCISPTRICSPTKKVLRDRRIKFINKMKKLKHVQREKEKRLAELAIAIKALQDNYVAS